MLVDRSGRQRKSTDPIGDSNGAHRGVRQPGARVRDAFFVEFCSETSSIWGGDVAAEMLDKYSFSYGNPLERFVAVEKKWERKRTPREFPTWIEQLPQVDLWLA